MRIQYTLPERIMYVDSMAPVSDDLELIPNSLCILVCHYYLHFYHTFFQGV